MAIFAELKLFCFEPTYQAGKRMHLPAREMNKHDVKAPVALTPHSFFFPKITSKPSFL